MSSDVIEHDGWSRIEMRELVIITRARAPDLTTQAAVFREGARYLGWDVRDSAGAVLCTSNEHLLELIPALRPARIHVACTDEEWPAMNELVATIKEDRRVIVARLTKWLD